MLVDKPDVSQAQINIGQFSVNRKDPDYIKLDIAQNVLGGGFSSRLTQKLRVQKGLVYDIHSDLDTDVFESVFKISTSTKNANIENVITETLATLKEFVENGITAEELETSQNTIQGRLLRTVEAPDSYVVWLASQKFYETNIDTVNQAMGEIKDVSLSQVNKAIKKHMSATNLKIVVVAPAKSVLKPLQKLGLVEVKNVQDY